MARNIAFEECSFVNESSHAFTGSDIFPEFGVGTIGEMVLAPPGALAFGDAPDTIGSCVVFAFGFFR